MSKDYKGMLRSTLGLDPSLDYLVEDDDRTGSISSTGSTSTVSGSTGSVDATRTGTANGNGNGTSPYRLSVQVQESSPSNSSAEKNSSPVTATTNARRHSQRRLPLSTPKPTVSPSPSPTASTTSVSSTRNHTQSNSLSSPLAAKHRSRLQKTTPPTSQLMPQRTLIPKSGQQQQTKSPKSVRFASPNMSPTQSSLTTPSPTYSMQMTPPPTTPASYLSWIGGNSPTRSPMLLSPDQVQEISERNRFLQSSWQEQQQQTRDLANHLDRLEKKHSPDSQVDKNYFRQQTKKGANDKVAPKGNRKVQPQVDHDNETATNTTWQRKYDELQFIHSETQRQLQELQQSHRETLAELEWHHQAHKESKEALEQNREHLSAMQQSHTMVLMKANEQIDTLQQRLIQNQKTNKQAVDQLEMAQSQIKQLQNQLDEVSKVHQMEATTHKETMRHLDEAYDRIEQLQNEVNVARTEADKYQNEAEAHSETLQQLEEALTYIDQLEKDHETFRKESLEHELLEEIHRKNRQELEETRAALEDLQDKFKDAQQDYTMKEQIGHDTTAEILQQLENARTEVRDLHKKLDAERAKIATKEVEKDAYNRRTLELDTLRQDVHRLNKELESARHATSESEDLQKGLTVELKQVLRRNQDLASELEETHQRCDDLQRQCDDATSAMDAIATQKVKLDQLQRETVAELERRNSECRELMDSVQQHVEANQEWQARCQALERELKKQQHLSQQSPSMSSHVANLQRNHAKELEEMHRQMMDATIQLYPTQSNYSASSSLDLTLSRIEINEIKEETRFFVQSPTKFVPDTSEFAALSPISPAPISTPESIQHEDQSLPDQGNGASKRPLTPCIDDLIDEIGEMDQERTMLLDGMGIYNAVPELTDNDRSNSKNDSSTSMLDATIDLLQKMKDMMTSPPPISSPGGIVLDDKETSVLEQLEVLSEMMGYNDGEDSLTLPRNGSLLSAVREEVDEPSHLTVTSTVHEESINDGRLDEGCSNLVEKSQDSVVSARFTIWADLVVELRRQIAFLEMDRSEVVRSTQVFLDEERKLEKLKIEAATARGYREGYDKADSRINEFYQVLFDQRLCQYCREQVRV